MIILTGRSDEAGMPESTLLRLHHGLLVLLQLLRVCETPQTVSPPANVRDWQDAQPEKMLDRYKVAPIGLPD